MTDEPKAQDTPEPEADAKPAKPKAPKQVKVEAASTFDSYQRGDVVTRTADKLTLALIKRGMLKVVD